MSAREAAAMGVTWANAASGAGTALIVTYLPSFDVTELWVAFHLIVSRPVGPPRPTRRLVLAARTARLI